MPPLEPLLPLAAIDPDDRRFGGKAAGLARLLRAGATYPTASRSPPGHRCPPSGRARCAIASKPLAAVSSTADAASRFARRRSPRTSAIARSPACSPPSSTSIRPRRALPAAERCIASGRSERVLAYAGAEPRARGRPGGAAHGARTRRRHSLHARPQRRATAGCWSRRSPDSAKRWWAARRPGALQDLPLRPRRLGESP